MSEQTVDFTDLDSDPFADDLGAQLEARAPRRYVTRTTVVLAGLVMLAGGFLAGAQVQKHFGTPPAATTTANRNATFAGGGFRGGATPGARAAASVTTGKVKLVDGTTVYVEKADGTVVTVRTSGSTTVEVAQKGALTDLAPGMTVSVEGPSTGQDTVAASKVTRSTP
jgi:hypothetical protein